MSELTQGELDMDPRELELKVFRALGGPEPDFIADMGGIRPHPRWYFRNRHPLLIKHWDSVSDHVLPPYAESNVSGSFRDTLLSYAAREHGIFVTISTDVKGNSIVYADMLGFKTIQIEGVLTAHLPRAVLLAILKAAEAKKEKRNG